MPPVPEPEPELPPVPPDGLAPPVPEPEPEPEPPPPPPDPVEPDPPVPAPPDEPDVPDEGVAPPDPPDAPAPAALCVELVELVELVVLVDALATVGTPLVGTVSGGAPLVSVTGAELLPQAEMPAAMTRQTTTEASGRVRNRPDIANLSGPERVHPPPAMGTVVEIPLGELIAPVAKTKVLDCPRKLGWGGGQRQQQSDDLKLLAGIPVQICPPRLGLDDHLAAGGRGPHTVLLANPHQFSCYQRFWRQTLAGHPAPLVALARWGGAGLVRWRGGRGVAGWAGRRAGLVRWRGGRGVAGWAGRRGRLVRWAGPARRGWAGPWDVSSSM